MDWNAHRLLDLMELSIMYTVPNNTRPVFFDPYITCQCVAGFQPTVTQPELAPLACAPCPPQYYFTNTAYHNDASQPVGWEAPGCLYCDGPPQNDSTYCFQWQPLTILGFIGYANGSNCSADSSNDQSAASNGIDGLVIVASDGVSNFTTVTRQGRFAFYGPIVISHATNFTISVDLASRPDLRIGGWPNAQLGVVVSETSIAMIELLPEAVIDNFNFCFSSCVPRHLLHCNVSRSVLRSISGAKHELECHDVRDGLGL